MIGTRRGIRETDFGQTLDECLLRDAVREGESNFAPVLSEAEFLIDQLAANKLVDSAAVIVIQRQFRHLTRRGNFETDEDRQLNPRQVYEVRRFRPTPHAPAGNGCPRARPRPLALTMPLATSVHRSSWREPSRARLSLRVRARAT